MLWLWRQPKYLQKSIHRRNKLHHYAVIKSPNNQSAMKKTEDNSTLVSIYVRVSKHLIKQAVKKLHGIDVTKANTPIRPD